MNTKTALLDASRVAEWTGLSTSTLAKLRLTGKGPTYIKLGRRVAYTPEDLKEWIEANRVRSTSEYATKVG